jgi:hypothetical protein
VRVSRCCVPSDLQHNKIATYASALVQQRQGARLHRPTSTYAQKASTSGHRLMVTYTKKVVDTVPSTDIVTDVKRQIITPQPYPLSHRKTDVMRCDVRKKTQKSSRLAWGLNELEQESTVVDITH